MEIAESVNIIKALADSSRLILVQALHEPQCVEELARRCNLAPSTVCFHLSKLEKSGLVTKKKDQVPCRLLVERCHLQQKPPGSHIVSQRGKVRAGGACRRYQSKVLRAFMKGGRVVRIPAQHKKRLIILEEIVKRFRAGETYRENEVDEMIEEMCSDYVSIRRAFIDEGMMEREKDLYRVKKSADEASKHTDMNEINKPSSATKVKTRQDIKREYKDERNRQGSSK